ncbi:MAG: DUF2586 family protein [Bacteroidia bacterium]
MAHTLPNVNVAIDNDRLGRIAPSSDGVSGLILSGVAVGGSFVLGDILEGNSLADFEALGITQAYDTTNTTNAWKHISDFYSWSENKGLKLYVMVVAKTVLMSALVDKTNANYAKKMLIAANGNVKLLGVCRTPDGAYTPTYAAQLDTDIALAMANAQALYDDEFNLFRPLQIFIEGYNWQGSVATSTNMRDPLTGFNANRVSLVIGNDNDYSTANAWAAKYASLGLFLGREAAIPVNRNAGRVKDGKLPLINAGFSNGNKVTTYTDANLDTLDDFGYIFFRPFTGKAGYYINDDHTASPYNQDALYISHGRVLDKAARIARKVYVDEILDEVQVEASTGKLAPSTCKHYQGIIEKAINDEMASRGEIVAVSAYVDPDQDVLTTDTINIEVDIVKTGTSRKIKVVIGFAASV